MGNAVTV